MGRECNLGSCPAEGSKATTKAHRLRLFLAAALDHVVSAWRDAFAPLQLD